MPQDAYPKRPRFFAYRFCRLVAKACLANEIGGEACWLLTVVAHTEDAKGYRSPVTFYNEQLFPLVGVGSVPALRRLRDKAVESGWLHYEHGGKGRAGRYWVIVPSEYGDWDDAPTDEGNLPERNRSKKRPTSDTTTDRQVVQEATEKRSPFFPSPSPDPNPKNSLSHEEPPEWLTRVSFQDSFDSDEVRSYAVKWVDQLNARRPLLDPALTITEAMRRFATGHEFVEAVQYALGNDRDKLTTKPAWCGDRRQDRKPAGPLIDLKALKEDCGE